MIEKIEIEINRSLLPHCTKTEFLEWLEYRLGIIGSLKASSPLIDFDLDCRSMRWIGDE